MNSMFPPYGAKNQGDGVRALPDKPSLKSKMPRSSILTTRETLGTVNIVDQNIRRLVFLWGQDQRFLPSPRDGRRMDDSL
jgi:hypothetical protein